MVIQEYQDPKVRKYLNYGYWYEEHKVQILKAVRLGLLAVAAVFWLIALYNGWVFYLSSRDYGDLLSSLAVERLPIEELHQARSPLPLVTGEPAVVLGRDENTADFLASVENPNSNWYFEVDYVFSWADGQTVSQRAFVLPGDKTWLMARGVTVNSLPVNASLDFTIASSKRIKDKAALARIQAVADGIVVSNAQASREDGVTSASYIVENRSIYDLITPRFIVLASQLQTIVAVAVQEVPELPAGETVVMESRWLQTLPAGLAVEVIPLVNVLEEGSYRLPPGEATPF